MTANSAHARKGKEDSMRRARTTLLLLMLTGLVTGVTAISSAFASGGGGCGRPVSDAHGTRVHIRNFCFTPTVLHIRAGQTVRFTNLDPFAHVVAGANYVWGSYNPLSGFKSVSYRFVRPGVYPYVCTFHPGMVGAIVVGNGNGRGAAGATTTERGPVVRANSVSARLTQASIDGAAAGSSGPWAVTTFIGFGLFLLAGTGLVLQRRRTGS
jgi:plastocyanin